jgi:CheY-like chemotaxis protein
VRRGLILVVEDEAIVGLELRVRLEGLGHEVLAVVGLGEDAVELAAQRRPDLVLMDIKLPGTLDGAQTAAVMRERFDIPTIFLSAYSDDATIERVQGVEPFGYLLKPYDERLLHVTIQSALYRALAERERATASEEKRRAEKAEAVARLAAGVVHDVNNLLSAIRVNAYVIQSQPEAIVSTQEAATDIVSAVERGAALMNDLVRLARDRRHTPLQIEIDALIHSTARLPDRGAARAEVQAGLAGATRAAGGGPSTVLIVDDDPVVRRALTKSLTRWGYRVLDAKDPSTALALVASEPIELMVTDLLMPEMNGYELAGRVAQLRPEVRIVYMSGYAPESLPGSPSQAGVDARSFLQKPFGIDELRQIVKELL